MKYVCQNETESQGKFSPLRTLISVFEIQVQVIASDKPSMVELKWSFLELLRISGKPTDFMVLSHTV
jgi:hypothetical protein